MSSLFRFTLIQGSTLVFRALSVKSPWKLGIFLSGICSAGFRQSSSEFGAVLVLVQNAQVPERCHLQGPPVLKGRHVAYQNDRLDEWNSMEHITSRTNCVLNSKSCRFHEFLLQFEQWTPWNIATFSLTAPWLLWFVELATLPDWRGEMVTNDMSLKGHK